MSLRRSFPLAVALLLLAMTAVSAQQPQNSPPANEQNRTDAMERMHRRGHGPKGERRAHRIGFFGLEGDLALSDAQKEQLRAIRQRNFESTKSLREELFKLGEKRRDGTFSESDAEQARTLHQQMRASREAMQTEAEALLTPAQRAKIDELKRERKERRGERKERRRELRTNEQ